MTSKGIRCPKCGGLTQVTETRMKPESIRRRRACLSVSCEGRVTTQEVVALGRGTAPHVLVPRSWIDTLRSMLQAADSSTEVIP